MRTYSPEDTWSNEAARAAQSAISASITFERAIEIFRECWVLELREEAERLTVKKLL